MWASQFSDNRMSLGNVLCMLSGQGAARQGGGWQARGVQNILVWLCERLGAASVVLGAATPK